MLLTVSIPFLSVLYKYLMVIYFVGLFKSFRFIVIFYLQNMTTLQKLRHARFDTLHGVSISHRNNELPPGTVNNRQKQIRTMAKEDKTMNCHQKITTNRTAPCASSEGPCRHR
jgi:hypothetical protein